jgi:hypothetical protein
VGRRWVAPWALYAANLPTLQQGLADLFRQKVMRGFSHKVPANAPKRLRKTMRAAILRQSRAQ